MSDEERSHALKLMNYQNSRGGIVQLGEISPPSDYNWKSLRCALTAALHLERKNTDNLMELFHVAEDNKDVLLMDYITAEFLNDQVNSLLCTLMNLYNILLMS